VRGNQMSSYGYIVFIRGDMRILQETLYAVRCELLSLEGGVRQRILKGWRSSRL
jgi:hypothetical protein